MIRKCKKCSQEKDLLFFVKKKKKDGTIYYLYTCLECNKNYNKSYFGSYYQSNKSKLIKTSREWYQNNTDKKKDYDKEYNKINKDKKKKYDKNYLLLNKDKINNRIYNYRKNRRRTDPVYRLRKSISYSVWYYLNLNNSDKNNESVIKYLPYTMLELKNNLESKFESWMTWDNYGSYHISSWDDSDSSTWKWNIDHIIPQSRLLYTSMEDDNFKKCWALDNLRPLSAKQNLLDGNKMESKKLYNLLLQIFGKLGDKIYIANNIDGNLLLSKDELKYLMDKLNEQHILFNNNIFSAWFLDKTIIVNVL